MKPGAALTLVALTALALAGCGSASRGAPGGSGSGSPVPTLTSLSDPYGVAGLFVDETLVGTGFEPGKTTVAVTGQAITVRDVQVVSATKLTVRFDIDFMATLGKHQVTVTTPAGTSGPVALTVMMAEQLVCAPDTQTVKIGETARLQAAGTDRPPTWSAPQGTPATGTGMAFATTYGQAGTYTVTVTYGGSTTCAVTVTP